MLKRKKDDKFFSLFAGAYVKVYARAEASEMVSGAEGTVIQASPLTITAFLLDYDDDFYYMGADADSVSSAIRKSDVILVDEVKLKDEYDLMLEDVSTGKKTMN